MQHIISARLSDKTSDGKMKLFFNLTKEHVEKFSLEKKKYISLSSIDKTKLIVRFHDKPIPDVTRKWKVTVNRVKDQVKGAVIPLDPSEFNLGDSPILGMEFKMSAEDENMVVDTTNTPLASAVLPQQLEIKEPQLSKWGEDLDSLVDAEIDRRIKTYFKLKFTLDL